MKILIVNKFLYQKGGSETYAFKLGEILENHGNEVQYFGLYDEKNIVGNKAESYVSPQDFQTGVLNNLSAPFRIIYSVEAREKIRRVLADFKPDVVHLNNIQFHLTPSIIIEIEKYRKEMNKNVKIVYTAHDFQLICPSHGLSDVNLNACEKCLTGSLFNCFKTKCMKNSRAKSLLAMLDGYYWKKSKAYSYIDTIICPSGFLKSKLDTQSRFADKTVVIHNFVDISSPAVSLKEDYVLYFGKLCRDKGIYTMLEACRKLQDIKFIVAGYGPAEDDVKKLSNIEFVGFKTGDELRELIQKAKFSVYPSECNENCPFSVLESQMYLTPVIGSNIGGIPELIQVGKTGELFEAGNSDDLYNKIRMLNDSPELLQEYTDNCKNIDIETTESYYKKLMKIYEGKI